MAPTVTQDSVQRLAESRDHMLLWMSRLPAHEHLYEADYFSDCRACALVAEKAAAIDSLIAERDDLARSWSEIANRQSRTINYLQTAPSKVPDALKDMLARAEAAEAKVKRLREAASAIIDADPPVYLVTDDDSPGADDRTNDLFNALVDALATPPSEGWQS